MSTLQEIQKLAPINLLQNSLKHLNGETGSNRCRTRTCQISANNDWEAVCCWLSEYQAKISTYRAYQKESERLLLWCLIEKKKALSSLARQDFEEYVHFLSNPLPSHVWCGPKGSKANQRHASSWRPFVGPLSASAKMTALTILDSLFQYLVAASYLEFNPLTLMRRKARRQQRQQAQSIKIHERILEDKDWKLLLNTLQNLPESNGRERDEKARLRFLVAILFLLGLRINELETHCWSAFRQIQGNWWFFVVGKGDKPGKIPVNPELLDEVIRFRQHLNLPELPSPKEAIPLIPSWHHQHSLGSRQMGYLLKKLAIKAAMSIEDDSIRASKLKCFSPHWLRHLSASMQDRVGIHFGHIKANHRHESDATTRRYVHAIDQDRHDDMKKLKFFLKII
jgi:integrase